MNTNKKIIVLIIISLVAWPSTGAVAGVSGTITREVIETVIERSARRAPQVVSRTSREVAAETLTHAVKRYGDDAIRLTDDGIEFLEIAAKHGDDVIEMGMKATPAARRALTENVALLPLARRVGVEALELEAKCPGLSKQIFATFGDDTGRHIAKNVPADDIPRLFGYAKHADSPATKKALVEQYASEGASLFQRIPPDLVFKSGLTVAVLYGTHRVSRPFDEAGDQMAENPRLVKHFINVMMIVATTLIVIFGCLLLWRFRLMPWFGKQVTPADIKQNPQTNDAARTNPIESDVARRVPALTHHNVPPQTQD